MMRWVQCVVVVSLLAFAGRAHAADPCPQLGSRQSDPEVATRIAAVACDENNRWQRPFIDTNGRLAGATVWEAEGTGLRDGGSPWRQVVAYWHDTGLLGQMAFKPGASDCSQAAINPAYPGVGCRGFVIDSPWSAAFVSWVMQRAGVPAFTTSGSHFDYVRAARVNHAGSPYLFLEPTGTAPGVGDMLCYVRAGRTYAHQGLVAAIDEGVAGLPMHCDIVVAVSPGHDHKAYLVGGNLLQAVTMRILNLNAAGRFRELPRRLEGGAECSPDAPLACDANRQDWAVLLKLKPQAQLAELGSVQPPAYLPGTRPQHGCCVVCVLGSGVPRCPQQGAGQSRKWGLPEDAN